MANEPNSPAAIISDASQSNSIELKSIESIFNKDPKKIKDVIGNHLTNLKECLSIITQSGGFPLGDLEMFIEDVKKFNKANGVKNPGIGVYLFREDVNDLKLHKGEGLLKAGDSSFSQVSFVLVPIEVEDGIIQKHYIKEKIEKIPAMIPGNEGTGLCPPSCR